MDRGLGIDTDLLMAELRRIDIELNHLLRQVGRSGDVELAERFYEKLKSMAGQAKRVRDMIKEHSWTQTSCMGRSR